MTGDRAVPTGRPSTRLPWLAHAIALIVLGLEVVQVTQQAGGTLIVWAIPILLFILITLFVGWFLAWHRPRMPLGWLLLSIPSLFALAVPVSLLGQALLPSIPDVAAWLLWYGADRGDSWSWIPPIGLLFTQIPLRFPDGRLPTRRWRWFSWYTIAALVVASLLVSTSPAEVMPGVANPTYVEWGDAYGFLPLVAFGVLLAPAFLGSIASLFVRYRRAGLVERAQLRWVFWAAAIVAGLLIGSWLWSGFVGDDAAAGIVGQVSVSFSFVAGLGYSLIPLAILFAVQRFGLYSIDRIISRTAAYAIVTLSAIAVYVVIVLAVTLLLPGLPSVGVALATLAAAAVFLPLLRVVQRWVDRRFNRAQYDAARVVEAFGDRIRNGADPHGASGDLLDAVDATLQPVAAGIWMPGGTR